MGGTCLLINERLFVLKEVHREMIGVSSENSEVKVSENCWRSSSTPEISAFFHRYKPFWWLLSEWDDINICKNDVMVAQAGY